MQAAWFGRRVWTLYAALLVSVPFAVHDAEAASRTTHASKGRGHAWPQASYASSHAGRRGFHFVSRGGALQCVPFARENTGIELSGNANTWWDGAEGLYERGARPEVGSILNFRANGRMRMGHVAVVANVIDARHIEIDHANWGRGGRVSRNIDVVDVSPNNDWTAVRVALVENGEFGSIYPTYGFIYDRPDKGVMVANAGVSPAPVLNPAPADLRSASQRIAAPAAATEVEEVAEAEDDAPVSAGRRRSSRYSRLHSQHNRGANHPTLQRTSARLADHARPHGHRHRS